MENNDTSNDYFSSFTIDLENENFRSNQENIPGQKLKARRKQKDGTTKNISSCATRFKIKVKYGGYFKLISNGSKRKYCFGRQKTFYSDPPNYGFADLIEDVSGLFALDESTSLSVCFLDKLATTQSFIEIVDDSVYELMLEMYSEEKEIVIYVTRNQIDVHEEGLGTDDAPDMGYEECSDYCHSEESYHSRHSDAEEEEDELEFDLEGEFYSYDKHNPKMEVGSMFPHVIAFRRALNHYAVIHDFEYNLDKSDTTRVTARCANIECKWRIHAAVTKDKVTFEIRTLRESHTCHGVNRLGNKHATKGWISDRIVDDVKKDGSVSVKGLKDKLEEKYSISLPYDRVWEGKELALQEIHGKWDDSFIQIGSFKNELLERNLHSVVEFQTEKKEENQHFQRFFVALGACIHGFLSGCRPYVGLDACHMKGKWKGVIAAATAIDGNNWMFPVAFAVMEGENEDSWQWFLSSLHKAIGMPEGLVISSDMQKGLQNALTTVYPLAERRECMRHLFSNFKKHFHGDLFKFGLWGAARTYSSTHFDALINEMKKQCPKSIIYLNAEHNNLWSRSQFGTTAKCDYLTNNIAETFNSWISEERHKPVIDMFDSIRQKIMVKFDRRRRIASTWKGQLVPKVANYLKDLSRKLNGYEVHRSTYFQAEVQKNGVRWAISLEEKTCTCRAWQVKGIPCVHAAALIASIRNAKWEDYVDSCFTINRFKVAYSIGITPMPSKNEWVDVDLGYKIFPPTLKRPAGRPRKNRIKASDETRKRSHKCSRCGSYGHHRNTCKNAVTSKESEVGTSLSQPTQGSSNRRSVGESNRRKKKACPSNIFKILEEENI